MTSRFIEGSKHPQGTAAVERHFAGGNAGQRAGTDPLLEAPPYGSSEWNTPNPSVATEEGQQNRVQPNIPGNSLFNASKPALPRELGVNYTPAAQAGHKVTDDPFSL